MTARKIIVGYDRSTDARAAAAWALDEAARTGALVEFLYEWPTWAPAASTIPAPAVWPDGETDRAIRGMLDEAVKNARYSHPSVHTEVSTVHAPAALTLVDRSAEASLVVVGSQGHSGVYGLLGSISVAVSAHAHCPVVVVRGAAAATDPVVVGVDDSEWAPLALEFAFDQAAARGVPLRVLRGWRPVAGLWEERPVATAAGAAEQRQALDDVLTGWRAKYPQVEVAPDVLLEHPAQMLATASTTAQLVVVGSRGRGALRGMLLGSVSQHLLHHAACTVAVVHEMGS
jgi:nucleotide-binding universal stress UspA family protein